MNTVKNYVEEFFEKKTKKEEQKCKISKNIICEKNQKSKLTKIYFVVLTSEF